MAKRFKLRISRVIPSFQSCRSKDPSDLPENPVPVFFHLSPVNPKAVDIDFPAISTFPDTTPSKPIHSSLRRQVSSAIFSVGCVFRSRSGRPSPTSNNHVEEDTRLPEFKWKEEDDFHVVARVHEEATPRRKIYNSSVSGESDRSDSPRLPPTPISGRLKIRREKKKKPSKSKVRTSTSSADSGWFSSEGGGNGINDDEETETLVSSSRSFSTDSSSDYNPHLETIREAPINGSRRNKKNTKKKKGPKKVRKLKCGKGVKTKLFSSPETELLPARLSVFRRFIPCTVDGKVRESFAVVKKSEDPREDFKRSMLEMILEKQIFEPTDLEQLLHCFLSLNSRHHHQAIVEAFSEIWEFLFCKNTKKPTRF